MKSPSIGAEAGDPARRTALARYGVAVLATALATALKLGLPDLIGRDVPIAVYLGAVMLTAWYGGARPGLLATALSLVAGSYWFAAPYDSFRVEATDDLFRLLFGGAEGVTISLFAGQLHAATQRANLRTAELAAATAEIRREGIARTKAESSLEQTHAQLLHAQRMQTVGELAGGVAHDLNNLLSVMLSYAVLVLGRLPAEDPAREHLEEIRDAANRAAELTRRLLSFARKAVVEPRVVDLRDTVRGLERMLRILAGEANPLSIELAPEPCRVRVDPTQMEQTLTNLTVNARDAMPRGGRIVIALGHVTLGGDGARALGLPGDDYVRLTVSDTGEGISEEVRARIFEPFFTTKEAGRGSGLGLAIVHGIVKGAAGAIGVESTPGSGTSFSVYLPRTRA